jgi:hypothetical protein
MAMNQAFEDWKAADEAYMAAERKLADAETVFACRSGHEPRQLRDEVNQLRCEADRLLEIAMRSLRDQAAETASAMPRSPA